MSKRSAMLLFLLLCCGVGLCTDVQAFVDYLRDNDSTNLGPLSELRQLKPYQERHQQQFEIGDQAAFAELRNVKSADSSDSSASSDDDDKTACQRCIDWYNDDRRDTSWLLQLNRDIPCPCKTSPGSTGHVPLNTLNGYWTVDPVCSRHLRPSCFASHPGADGCLLSAKVTSTGARQQCCYSGYGKLLAYDAGGTPDRYSDPVKHKRFDVDPFRWCCMECMLHGYCKLYRDLRRGTNAHCKRV